MLRSQVLDRPKKMDPLGSVLRRRFRMGGQDSTQTLLRNTSIYDGWFLKFFIYIIPLACVNYFPVLTIIGKPDPLHFPAWLGWVSPLSGFAFLAGSLLVWEFGVRHYRSTGT
jgi:ABC-2 type transport system permease protein